MLFAIVALIEFAAIATGGSIFLLGFAIVASVAVAGNVWQYRVRLRQRELLRWENYDAVEDWIISASLPAASDELVKREHEDARAYKELMAKQGKRPDGSQAPDPNSNRSKKRAARKERARARKAERELEEQIISAMNDRYRPAACVADTGARTAAERLNASCGPVSL
jgi:hypothetical protein